MDFFLDKIYCTKLGAVFYSRSPGLEYTDDMAVLTCTQTQIRDKTDKVWQTSR